MSEQEIKVPDLGGADEVEVIEVLVSEGDSVEEEDPILTVESDKASFELPAPYAGKITKLSVKVGDKLSEGDLVGTIDTDGAAGEGGDDEEPGKDEEKDTKDADDAKKEGADSGGDKEKSSSRSTSA